MTLYILRTTWEAKEIYFRVRYLPEETRLGIGDLSGVWCVLDPHPSIPSGYWLTAGFFILTFTTIQWTEVPITTPVDSNTSGSHHNLLATTIFILTD